MKPSISRRLVINLLIAVAAIIILTACGIYYITNIDIQKRIDAQLISSNLVFQAILEGNNLSPASLKNIQIALSQIPSEHQKILEHYQALKSTNSTFNYDEALQYQVWDHKGNLLLHSAQAPTLPMSNGQPGFSNFFINGASWRVYTDDNQQEHITVIVAENYLQQEILKNAVATNNLIIMLISFPLLGILIWLIVTQSLVNVRRAANEISQRAAGYLEPVSLDNIPVEIEPLIEELNKLFESLRQAFEREQRFAADAAHELRTPMAAIRTQTQVALNSQSTQDLKAALYKILSGVDRSAHVVQQLLTLSRLNPGSSMDQQNAVNIVIIVTDIISELAPLAIENDTELEFICAKNNITLLGNAASLGILVRNLVDNAIRYTAKSGKVIIELEEKPGEVILRVTDNGPGIPEKLHSRVFERFFRVLGTQKPGSGLGLAIVQQISTLHHAKLTLGKPEQGTGLVVEINFPNQLK